VRRFLERLLGLDRRWIFLFVLLSVAVPIIVPIGLPIFSGSLSSGSAPSATARRTSPAGVAS